MKDYYKFTSILLTFFTLITALYLYIAKSLYLDISPFFKPKEYITGIFNSSQLSLVYFFQDVMQHHASLRDWAFSPVPYFFPDGFFYFILATFVKNNYLAVLLVNGLWLFFYYVLIVKVGELVCGKKSRQLFSLSGLLSLVFASGSLSKQEIFVPLWTSHFGSTVLMFLLGIYCILLDNLYKKLFYRLCLSLITLLTSLSDPYFFILFFGSVLFGSTTLPNQKNLLITIFLSGLLGYLINLFDLLHLGIHSYFNTSHSSLSLHFSLLRFERLEMIFSIFYKDNLIIFLIMLLCCGWGVSLFFKRSTDEKKDFIFITVAFAIILSFFASAAIDSDLLKPSYLSLRHFQTAILLPTFLCLPLFISRCEPIVIFINRYYPYFLITLLAYLILFKPVYPIKNTLTFYPAITQCLDQYAEKKQLPSKNGLAHYWDAHVNDVLSQQHLNIVAVNRLSPYNWLSTRHDYQGKVFHFLLVRKITWSKAAIIRKWGAPSKILTCSQDTNYDIFVYSHGIKIG